MVRDIEFEDGVVEVVIDRPPVNALGLAELAALEEHITSAVDRPSTRVLVLRSEGAGFCGGGDVKEVQALRGADGILGQARGVEAVSMAICRCPVPVVAAVHGYCVGAGALIVACADILVMAEGSYLVLAEIDNGATTGATHMANLLPERYVRRAMFTGDPIPAADLERLGSTGPLVDPDRLVDDVRSLAVRLAAKPAEALRQMKRSLEAVASPDALRRGYREELSGTFEMNLTGDAQRSRQGTVGRLDRT